MKFIKKLISVGFVYFAIATLIAQTILLGYFWFSWGVNWKRGQDATAVLRGNATIETVIDLENVAQQVPKEQPSFEEILQARALKTRDFELRGETLSQGKAMLRQRQETFAKESETFSIARIGFERQVADYETRSQSEGLEQNIAMIQGLTPELAKVQLLRMYHENEMESLIDIIKGMELRNCTKILNIFTTKDDEAKLAEIFRRIRDGFEFKPPIDNTAGNLPPQI